MSVVSITGDTLTDAGAILRRSENPDEVIHTVTLTLDGRTGSVEVTMEGERDDLSEFQRTGYTNDGRHG